MNVALATPLKAPLRQETPSRNQETDLATGVQRAVAFCRGSGPCIRGMQQRVPEKLFFFSFDAAGGKSKKSKGEEFYENLPFLHIGGRERQPLL